MIDADIDDVIMLCERCKYEEATNFRDWPGRPQFDDTLDLTDIYDCLCGDCYDKLAKMQLRREAGR